MDPGPSIEPCQERAAVSDKTPHLERIFSDPAGWETSVDVVEKARETVLNAPTHETYEMLFDNAVDGNLKEYSEASCIMAQVDSNVGFPHSQEPFQTSLDSQFLAQPQFESHLDSVNPAEQKRIDKLIVNPFGSNFTKLLELPTTLEIAKDQMQ